MNLSSSNAKIKVVASIAGAIVLAIALGATGAIAASRALSAGDEPQAVIDDAAQQLGVESADLSDALKQALKNQIDRAVESGRLTGEQGSALKERIDSGGLPLPFGSFGHKGFGGKGHWHAAFGGIDTAASYLGVTEAELRSELADGKTLADVARAQGKSGDGLIRAMVGSATARIDQAVADGKLTEEQAAAARQRVEERVTALVNAEMRPRDSGLRKSDRGPGFRGGPWHHERPGP
ncbi:MAG: hypothetical protein R6W48_04715 [Gaiellaceae bacterium]